MMLASVVTSTTRMNQISVSPPGADDDCRCPIDRKLGAVFDHEGMMERRRTQEIAVLLCCVLGLPHTRYLEYSKVVA